jgi:hypothetical protein
MTTDTFLLVLQHKVFAHYFPPIQIVDCLIRCASSNRQSQIFNNQSFQGSGYFFHGKMPGCCLPSQTAATALHFTTCYLKRQIQQEPTPCFAFLGGNSPLPVRSAGAISLS